MGVHHVLGLYGCPAVVLNDAALLSRVIVNAAALSNTKQLRASSADEFLYHEALVHPAMIQIPSPQNVLIVGGGDGGAAREALRWRSARRVVVVEVDRDVVEACREHLPEIHQNVFDDPRLEVVIDDGLRFLRSTNRTLDVIIFDLPDPVNDAPWLKLYEKECFAITRDRLSHEGTFTFAGGSGVSRQRGGALPDREECQECVLARPCLFDVCPFVRHPSGLCPRGSSVNRRLPESGGGRPCDR